MIDAVEYRRMMGMPEPGTLPETTDAPGLHGRAEATAVTLTIAGTVPPELFPNWSPKGLTNKWAIANKAAAPHVANCQLACVNQPYILGPVVIAWHVYLPKGGKAKDRDNHIAALKKATDVIVKAGIIEDDNWRIVTRQTVEQVKWSDHRRDPRIVCQIASARIEP